MAPQRTKCSNSSFAPTRRASTIHGGELVCTCSRCSYSIIRFPSGPTPFDPPFRSVLNAALGVNGYISPLFYSASFHSLGGGVRLRATRLCSIACAPWPHASCNASMCIPAPRICHAPICTTGPTVWQALDGMYCSQHEGREVCFALWFWSHDKSLGTTRETGSALLLPEQKVALTCSWHHHRAHIHLLKGLGRPTRS